jgi:hypothetical protein
VGTFANPSNGGVSALCIGLVIEVQGLGILTAAPSTPSMAIPTALSRCTEVTFRAKSASIDESVASEGTVAVAAVIAVVPELVK